MKEKEFSCDMLRGKPASPVTFESVDLLRFNYTLEFPLRVKWKTSCQKHAMAQYVIMHISFRSIFIIQC